jgi:DNA-binding XRE family transcriptional regulator
MSWRADDGSSPARTAPLLAVRSRPVGRGGCGLAAVVRPVAPSQPAGPAGDLESLVGMRVRRLRHERRWSLDQLSATAGVSRAMLGQIELGKSMPTVRVLLRIASGLGVDVTTLLAPAPQPKLHVFRADGAATACDTAPVVRALHTGLPGSAALHAVHLPPGAAARHPDTARACRINAVVARGTVEVTIDGTALTLDEHDALQVDAATALHWRNAGDGAALIHAVWVENG